MKLYVKIIIKYTQKNAGQNNFSKVVKMLCKKGTMETGLSSYFVQLQDVSVIFTRMIKRLGGFPNVIRCGFVGDNTDIKN